MITFYLEARPHMNGAVVEVALYEGTHAGSKSPMGAWSFTRPQWEAFRPLIIAGMRNARVPVEMMDGTRLPAPRVQH